jgi:hypothetical protein
VSHRVLLAAEQAQAEVATFDERLAAAGRDRGLEVRERWPAGR